MQTPDIWQTLLPCDPRPLLAASADPSARHLAMIAVFGRAAGDLEVEAVRRQAVGRPEVRALVDSLPDWAPPYVFGGHASPAFAPNLLRLLFGLGVRAGDFPRVDAVLGAMQSHQADYGRFLTPGKPEAPWSSLPCDHFAILEVLLLFGHGHTAPVGLGLKRLARTFDGTAQGPGWLCLPDPVARWRGPGRKGDLCPQVTVE
ncbi:MAG: hypothetical protein WAT70_11140, partial [Rhizobiaceae bacterium]